jgi:DNA ligase (NAD+)
LVRSIADLYDLTYDQLIAVDRMADKSVRNLLDGVETSKSIPFERVLFALGIRFVGETVAKKLAKHFKSLEDVQRATFDELTNVDEIGEKIAIAVQQYFLSDQHLQLITRLKAAGLQFQLIEKENASNKLADKAFVVSGVFNSFSRDEIKQVIEENGGKNVSSISSKTDFVIAGDNMGPAKLKKATDLGIPILSEDEFIQLLKT